MFTILAMGTAFLIITDVSPVQKRAIEQKLRRKNTKTSAIYYLLLKFIVADSSN